MSLTHNILLFLLFIGMFQMKVMQAKSTAKYESKIKELTMQCDLKAKECYQAWMSLTATNEQLEEVQMELDKVTFNSLTTGKFCRVPFKSMEIRVLKNLIFNSFMRFINMCL